MAMMTALDHQGVRRSLAIRARVVAGLAVVVVIILSEMALGLSTPAGAAVPTVTPTLLGPVSAAEESPTFTLPRDEGKAVALPNGKELWIFGDTPEWTFSGGSWSRTNFIVGSTAAEGSYTPGSNPTDLNEVVLGSKTSPGNPPTQYIPGPTDIFNPDPTVGGYCVSGANSDGKDSDGNDVHVAYPARWPNGVTMMPNGKDVLVSYIDLCLLTNGVTVAEGWGFMETNYRTNVIDAGPYDVFAPQPPTSSFGDDAIPADEHFTSPVATPKKINFSRPSVRRVSMGCARPEMCG